jgi:ribosomal protein S18 acetylase RimI-like enzyme
VRPARARDFDAVWAIETESFGTDRFPRRNLRRLLSRRSAAFLIAGAPPLGYALVLFRRGAGVARLYSIATSKAARGRGVGAALVEAAAACAKSRGSDRLRLEVRVSNKAAIALYSKAGFSILKESPGYYEDGETALKMEKRLATAEERRK